MFGMFFGEDETNPCGDNEQNNVAWGREKVAEYFNHIIAGFVQYVYEAKLQPWGRR